MRVSNQITHVIYEAQAKVHLAAALDRLTTNRQCETAAELNGCPIGRVKYLQSQSQHEVDFDCDGTYDG